MTGGLIDVRVAIASDEALPVYGVPGRPDFWPLSRPAFTE